MSEQEKEQNKTEEPVKEQAQYTPSVQAEFMREKIKQKPVNKKKLLRRTGRSNARHSDHRAARVVRQSPQFPVNRLIILQRKLPVHLRQHFLNLLIHHLQIYLIRRLLYGELRTLADDACRAVVTVAGVTSDVDWFNNIYENVASASGVIVANNEKALLILVSAGNLNGADSIEVTFCDQTQVEAELVQKDENTGLAILSVPLSAVGSETMEKINIAELGSSNTNLLGMPVVALGSPLGTGGSISYGMVTSTGTVIDRPDSEYKRITTDIYGSRNATGILINLKGMVIGIIDNVNTGNDMSNLLTAYGITELKRTIEQMSNDKERAYLGVHGADVPKEAIEDTQIDTPAGTYVREIEIDSPAMAAGIQSGDVVTRVGNTEITTYHELLDVLQSSKPDDVLTVTLTRQGHEMSVDVTLGSW